MANLTLDASEIASGNARLPKGTELVFGNDRVRVDKTTTIASEGSAVVPVRVVGPGAATIGIGEAVTLESGAFNLAFNDITLDLGGFVSDLLGPIITTINDVIEPFRPIIDVLSSEVELLSKIGLAGIFDQDDDGTATLVEVALTLAGGLSNGDTAARFTRFVDSVTGVIELAESLSALQESIDAGDSIALEFGSYQLQNFKGGSSAEDATEVDAETEGVATDPAMTPEDQTMATGNNRVGNFFSKLDDLGNLARRDREPAERHQGVPGPGHRPRDLGRAGARPKLLDRADVPRVRRHPRRAGRRLQRLLRPGVRLRTRSG